MEASVEKSARSCFVGNIPYEATEEKLKEIFSSVGPVLSFKLVYDRESGKPRGYGFCEFMDPETASSAMRNMNGFEIGGRSLRVDSASTEKSRIEIQNLNAAEAAAGGPAGVPVDKQYGESIDPKDAPEAINKAVASLPPEQMFELMKQMKDCIINNPQEARDMLIKNPQLAYALLQALVVMRIVDPEMALAMLHKQPPKPMAMGGAPQPVAGIFPGPPARPLADVGPPAGYGNPDPRVAVEDPSRFTGRDPRDRDRPPRRPMEGPPPGHPGPPPGHPGPPPGHPAAHDGPPPQQQFPGGIPPHLSNTDPDKARLIMQVLSLTDAQIAQLPRDQQASIMELKKQIHTGPK